MQHFLATYLLNAAWQAPVVATCALIVARFSGLSPEARNRVWLTFLGVAVILPGVALDKLLPHALRAVARVPTADVALSPDSLPAPTVLAAPTVAPVMQLAPWSAWAMIALCALVAALLATRLVGAGFAARRLVAQSTPTVLPPEVAEAMEKLAHSHDRAVPPVRRSVAARSPAVVGAVRPVILIPQDLSANDDELRAALLHEMAHVVRHDYAINLACEVLTLPVCWHPAVLGLKVGVRRSRELACDAIAARAMTSQKTYARCLVSLAQSLGAAPTQSTTEAALAVGLFGRSDLEDRLMHLMRPRDAEAPAIRAARLCGLAAVGASLIGSAALLHVTPVFAQSAPAVKAVPAPLPVTAAPLDAVPASPPKADASAPPAGHHRSGLVFSRNGVLIETGETGYRHSFTASDGRKITVTTDDPNAPTAEQQHQWEDEARKAEAKAAEVEKMVNSPEFKAKIEKAKASAAAAEKMINSPEFKARIAKATEEAAATEKMVNSPEFKARIEKAQAEAAEVEKTVNSPEFKARIAKAQLHAAEVEKMVNSAEFKARIARAQARAAEVEKMVNSPEFKDEISRAAAEAAAAFDDTPWSSPAP